MSIDIKSLQKYIWNQVASNDFDGAIKNLMLLLKDHPEHLVETYILSANLSMLNEYFRSGNMEWSDHYRERTKIYYSIIRLSQIVEKDYTYELNLDAKSYIETNTIYEYILELIAKDDLKKALSELKALLSEKSEVLGRIAVLSARLSRCEKNIGFGISELKDIEKERNRISAAIINLLENIEAK